METATIIEFLKFVPPLLCIGIILGLTTYAFYDIMVDRDWRAR